MTAQYDILEVLGISDREDSFSNLISYLFHNNSDFKYKFSEKFLKIDENSKLDDIVLIKRNAFVSNVDTKIIPDLIIYSRKLLRIAVIEVKIFSGQGDSQLSRYESRMDTIISQLDLSGCNQVYMYYLSLYNDIGNNPRWKYFNWTDISDLFTVQDEREDINYLINAVRNRIDSVNIVYEYNHVKDLPFNNYLKWNLWKSPSISLEEILRSCDNNTSKLAFLNLFSSSGFAPADHCVQTNLYFKKKEWLSSKVYDDENSNITNCYDFHVEIRISTFEEYSYFTIRLDHHLNPYESKSKRKETARFKEFYESRKSFLYNMKHNKHTNLGKERGYEYSKTVKGDYLSIISKDIEFDNMVKVNEVINTLIDEVLYLSEKIEVVKEELINAKK